MISHFQYLGNHKLKVRFLQKCLTLNLKQRYFEKRILPVSARQEGKSVNLKTGVTGKQSTPNFPKKEHFLSPDTYTCETFYKT